MGRTLSCFMLNIACPESLLNISTITQKTDSLKVYLILEPTALRGYHIRALDELACTHRPK